MSPGPAPAPLHHESACFCFYSPSLPSQHFNTFIILSIVFGEFLHPIVSLVFVEGRIDCFLSANVFIHGNFSISTPTSRCSSESPVVWRTLRIGIGTKVCDLGYSVDRLLACGKHWIWSPAPQPASSVLHTTVNFFHGCWGSEPRFSCYQRVTHRAISPASLAS